MTVLGCAINQLVAPRSPSEGSRPRRWEPTLQDAHGEVEPGQAEVQRRQHHPRGRQQASHYDDHSLRKPYGQHTGQWSWEGNKDTYNNNTLS